MNLALLICLVASQTPGEAIETSEAANAETRKATKNFAPSWLDKVDVHGFVDTYYAFNFNRPADRSNFIAGTGTTAKRHGEVGLNLAALEIGMRPEPVGFTLVLSYGTGSEVVHAGEPSGAGVGRDAFRFVQQASVMWHATSRLLLEAGIYPSHIGLEVLQSKDNWSYTRGWMGELSPYYQTGVKAAYAFTDHFSGQLHLLNGWQVIGDNNQSPAFGGQLAWSFDRWSLALNGFAGPELAGDSAHWRYFGDSVATVKITSKLSLAATIDAGWQERPQSSTAKWQAGGLHARYAFNDHFALAGRGELFHDPDNGISGTAQTLSEGTLTFEVRPVQALIIKLEGRYDHSTSDVFSGATLRPDGLPVLSREQFLAVLGAVAAF